MPTSCGLRLNMRFFLQPGAVAREARVVEYGHSHLLPGTLDAHRGATSHAQAVGPDAWVRPPHGTLGGASLRDAVPVPGAAQGRDDEGATGWGQRATAQGDPKDSPRSVAALPGYFETPATPLPPPSGPEAVRRCGASWKLRGEL